MVALPESFINYDHDYLLKRMVGEFKKQYGVECFASLHHKKRKTNLHIHIIFAERKRLEQPMEKVATRNMFYDEHGHHARTKKEILERDGNIRKGCKIIKKSEVYECKIFTTKDGCFKQESFLDEVKVFYTDLTNQMVLDDKYRLSIFDKNGSYLATKKVGKNNPKAEEIKADNEIRIERNRAIFEREKKRDRLKKELSECTGIFKGGRRKELQQEIDGIDTQISNIKKWLSSIVKEYMFDFAKGFYKEFNASKREYLDYKDALAEYEKTYGEKAADSMSLKERLRQKEKGTR